MRYFKFVILLIAALILLSSCGFKDIDKRAFVVSIGIDKPEDMEKGYEVSLKIAIPSSESKKQSEDFILLTESGHTIAEIVRLLKAKYNNELDFGHMKIIIFGEQIVKEDITQIMDWFSRRRDIQQIAYVGMGKPTAKQILELKPKGERLPSNTLFLYFGETGTESPYITTNYLFHFRRNLVERGVDGYLPIIEVAKENFSITTMSIISNGKQALVLNQNETKNFNILNKGYDKVSLTVPHDEKHKFILAIDQLSTDFQIFTPKNQDPYIEYNLNFTGVIEESMIKIDNKNLESYSEKAELTSRKNVIQLLEKFRDKGVDPMGFGLRYRATHTGSEEEKWKTWEEIYPKIKFKVNVSAEIKGTGVIE